MEDEIELKDYAVMLKRHWIMAAAVFFIVLLAAVVYVVAAPRVYEASSQVLISRQDQMSYLMDSPTYSVNIDTEKAIVMSSAVLGSVDYRPEEYKLDVDSAQDSDVLIIKIQSKDPSKSMIIANQVAQSYVNYSAESKINRAVDLNSFIDKQLETYKAQLDSLNKERLEIEDASKAHSQELENINSVVDDYNDMKKACEAELADLQDQLAEAGVNESGNASVSGSEQIENAIASKTEECSSISAKYGTFLSQQQELINTTDASDEIRNKSILQAISAKEKIYDFLLSKREEIGIMAQESSGNAQIIEYATMPLEPAKPNVILTLLIGMVLAAFAGIGSVIIQGSLKNTFRNTKEIEAGLGTIVGSLPIMGKKKHNPLGHYRMFEEHPESAAAENIRILRGRLSSAGQMISITSPQEGDGKSVIASNLGIAYASAGKKVLLVDSNLRNPMLSRVFKVSRNTPGLYDVLVGPGSKAIKVSQTVQKNLYLLPAGKTAKNIDAISNERIGTVCKKLRESDFDIVIFDNTSLDHADASAVSACSDAVLVAIDMGLTNKDTATQAKETLIRSGAKVFGIVVNRR